MTRARGAVEQVGRTLLIAFLIAPAYWPLQMLYSSAIELAGGPAIGWLPLLALAAVSFGLAETYEGSLSTLLPTAFLAVALFVVLEWLVGLRELNVISVRLLAAEALVYLASISLAVAIVYRTDLPRRIGGIGVTDDRAPTESESSSR